MIVTADPLGDFNATSQILRYSALAREVTVPRIPSTTSTLITNGPLPSKHPTGGRNTPNTVTAEELEHAYAEITRLGEENDALAMRITEEEIKRTEAEMKLRATEERCELVEIEVREECWAEMEAKIEEERARWKATWLEEADRNDEHLDRKLDILSRGVVDIYEDEPRLPNNQRVLDLEDENAALARRVEALERELQCRSPTKKQKLKMPLATANAENLLRSAEIEKALKGMHAMNIADADAGVAVGKTPGKKVRKLTTRKWDLGDEALSP